MIKEKTTYWYTAGDYDVPMPYTTDTRYDLEDEFDVKMLMESIAEHYWDTCDGWEDCWPVDFTLQDPSNREVVLYTSSIDMEARPHFMASPERVEKKD